MIKNLLTLFLKWLCCRSQLNPLGNALYRYALTALVGLLLVKTSRAQTVTWVGSVSTGYETPTNWDVTTFSPLSPVGTETVVIGAGNPYNPIQVGGNSTKRVAKLSTITGALFTVRGIIYPYGSDMLNGNISVEGNADFNIRSNVIIGNAAAGTVTVLGGNFSCKNILYVGRNAGGIGTLNIWGGKVNAGTDLQVGTNGATGSISFKSVGTLAVPGNKVAYLQGLVNSGVITVDGGRQLDIVYNATTNITQASIYQDPNSLVKEFATDVVLDNGTVKATIRKSSGEVLSILYNGKEMISQTGAHTKIYYDWTSSYGFETMGNCTFSITTLTDSIADLSFKRIYAPDAGQFTPADMDIHYVLKRNDTGLYTYSITEHQPGYPNVDLGSWRMVMWIGNDGVKNLCEKIYVDSIRHWEMPSVYDYSTGQATGIAEIIKLTTGARAGKYDGKYEYSKELWELNAVGHASDINSVGTWFVYGSHEFFNDGPSYADLNAAAGIIHATLNGVHYNSKGFVIPQGEYWRKIYGPFLIYFNNKTTGDEAWQDAKERAKKEQGAWPYAWLKNNPEYPLKEARGSVSGKLTIHDPFKPAMNGANAWIGVTQLSNADNQWQFEAKNYHYWVKTDANGNFTIPNIRPGVYTLFAYKKGEIGEYALQGVTVTAGTNYNIGELVWSIARDKGGLAWEIGVADRTAGEFKYGDQAYMEGFLWNDFGKLFPNPIEYNVADKNWNTVLNYVHSPYPDSTTGGLSPWKWRINFDLPAGLPTTGNATLTIAYASADHSNQYVYVNNENARLTNFYPPNSGGNALLRQENHAKYGTYTVSIPMSRLKAGKNTITLVMASTQAMGNHVMYDYLSLEVPGIPTARLAATPATGKAPLNVTFNGSASATVAESSLAYQWDFGDNTVATGAAVTHTYATHGTYKATLKVTDSNHSTDTTSIIITALNNAPVAAITATPTAARAPLQTIFDASQSYDADRDSLTYTWYFGDATSATGMRVTHLYPTHAQYTVTLLVRDNLGATDTATVVVTALNNTPVARLTASTLQGQSPLSVLFDALASTDADNDSLTFAWNFGDGAVGAGARLAHTYAHGTYSATLTVTDIAGARDTTSVIITARNNAPVAAFTTTPAWGYAPLAVTVDASTTTDADGDSLRYHWRFGDGETASGLQAQHTYASPGTYTLALLAVDNLGATDTVTTTLQVESGVKVQYRVEAKHSNPFDQELNPDFQLINTSNRPIPYGELSLRYWYTDEGSASQRFRCNYAALGTRQVMGNFFALPVAVTGANNYLELTFSSNSAIPAGGTSGEIKTSISKTNFAHYDERDDYSYDATKRQYADWAHVTLYRNGKLFWGTEPAEPLTPPAGPGPGEGNGGCRIFPNPARGLIQVEANLAAPGNVQIYVYNIVGALMLTENSGPRNAGGVHYPVDVSLLAAGTYYMKVALANEVSVLIFIKE